MFYCTVVVHKSCLLSVLDVIPMSSLFGEGEGPVHAYNIICQGDEPHLLNCSHLKVPANVINPHVADAGVRCFNLTGEQYLDTYTYHE